MNFNTCVHKELVKYQAATLCSQCVLNEVSGNSILFLYRAPGTVDTGRWNWLYGVVTRRQISKKFNGVSYEWQVVFCRMRFRPDFLERSAKYSRFVAFLSELCYFHSITNRLQRMALYGRRDKRTETAG